MRILSLVAVATLMLAPAAHASKLDENAQRAIDAFDIERAFLSPEQMFKPHHVKETQSLAEALEASAVTADMRLVLLERDEGRVAFLVQQIAYHHVAQGEMEGEPYMVSF